MKIERTRIHFFGEVFSAVAVTDREEPGVFDDVFQKPGSFLNSGLSPETIAKMAASLSEYENSMFLELMDDDGLFVTAKCVSFSK